MFRKLLGFVTTNPYLVGGGILLIGIALFTIHLVVDRAFDEAKDSGKNEVIVESLEKGMKDVETTKKAVERLNADPSVRNSECLRDARNPEDCPNQ